MQRRTERRASPCTGKHEILEKASHKCKDLVANARSSRSFSFAFLRVLESIYDLHQGGRCYLVEHPRLNLFPFEQQTCLNLCNGCDLTFSRISFAFLRIFHLICKNQTNKSTTIHQLLLECFDLWMIFSENLLN